MEKFNELKALVASLEEDATKFYEKDLEKVYKTSKHLHKT